MRTGQQSDVRFTRKGNEKAASSAPFSQLMDSLYEEDPWWETDKQQPRINPSHFEYEAFFFCDVRFSDRSTKKKK